MQSSPTFQVLDLEILGMTTVRQSPILCDYGTGPGSSPFHSLGFWGAGFGKIIRKPHIKLNPNITRQCRRIWLLLLSLTLILQIYVMCITCAWPWRYKLNKTDSTFCLRKAWNLVKFIILLPNNHFFIEDREKKTKTGYTETFLKTY